MIFFFILIHGKVKLKTFTEDFNNFTANLKFTYESGKEAVSFLDLKSAQQ